MLLLLLGSTGYYGNLESERHSFMICRSHQEVTTLIQSFKLCSYFLTVECDVFTLTCSSSPMTPSHTQVVFPSKSQAYKTACKLRCNKNPGQAYTLSCKLGIFVTNGVLYGHVIVESRTDINTQHTNRTTL